MRQARRNMPRMRPMKQRRHIGYISSRVLESGYYLVHTTRVAKKYGAEAEWINDIGGLRILTPF